MVIPPRRLVRRLATVAVRGALLLLAAFLVAGLNEVAAQVTLSGTVIDAATDEPLRDANVFLPARETGAVTDAQGRYAITLPAGTYDVRYSFVGYETQTLRLTVRRDTTVDVRLVSAGILDVVTVRAQDDADVQAPVLGITRMEIGDLERLPSFMGEVDVTRGLLQLPGVTSVGEGSGGMNVRGGNVDQNLVLLDGSQVFFASHLFGLFSTFNPDLIQDVTLYRGSIPARFGGRISSVLKVEQRDARVDRVGVRGGVGLMASRLAVEGPIAGDRLTAIIGARASYVNWLLGLAQRPELKNSNAGYADLGGRVTFRPTDRLYGSVSTYLSTDSFRFGADTTYHYDTRNASLRLGYAATDNVAARIDAALSNYAYGFGSETPALGFDYDAEFQHLHVRPSVAWDAGPALLEIGIAGDSYRLRPGVLAPLDESVIASINLEEERAVDLGAYLSADAELGRLRVEAGLRYTRWTTLGPATVPVLDPDLPRGPSAIVDTLTFARGETVQSYGGLEPRLALRFMLSEDAAIKAGYSRLRQNVHLLSNTTAPTPIDRWKLSDPLVRPQLGDQVSAGVYGPILGGITASIEGYYRWLTDVPAYRPGASLLLNPFVAADLLDAEGRAYGVELMLERTVGSLTGTASYAYTRSERRAFANHPAEQVNFGEWFPSDFDRPHDVALFLEYQESEQVAWGINFVFSSGRPITYPTGVYDLGDLVIPSYTLRNQARLPSYHRLDLSLTVQVPKPGTGPFNGRLTVAVYNVYNRRNAYSVFFRQQAGTRIPQAYRLSTLGSVFPSISYSFDF